MKYYNVFMQAPVALCTINSHFIIEAANNCFLKIFNNDATIINQSILNLLTKTYATKLQIAIESNDKKNKQLNVIFSCKDQFYILNFELIDENEDVKKEYIITLKNADFKYKNLIKYSPYPICIFKGADMVLEMANQPLLDNLKITSDDVGKKFNDLFPDFVHQPFMNWLTEVYQTGVTKTGIEQPIYFYNKHELVEIKYFNYSYVPYLDNDGSIIGVMAIGTNVTQQITSRKQMELQAIMVEKLLMTAPACICTFEGPKHKFNVVNEKYQQLFGNRILKGKPILEALPEIAGQGFDTLLDNVYKTGEPFVGIEVPIMLSRDENLAPALTYFNFSYQAMYDANDYINGILVFGYEVTEQVIAKNRNVETQENVKKQLEKTVLERTNALILANEELQQKNQDIAVSMYNKQFLAQFSERFSGAGLQNDFFNSLVQFIADITKLDYVFVGEVVAVENNANNIETVSMCAFGKIIPNIIYPLKNGPCEEVIYGNIYNYPENCSQLFPESVTLKKYNIEGSVGLPLFNSENKKIGLIAVMHTKNIEDSDNVTSILKIVAKRAEMEFERINNQQLLENNNKILAEKNIELIYSNELLYTNNIALTDAKEKLLSEYARNLIEATLDPLITIDTKGKITDVNEAMVKATDKKRSELIGSDFKTYFVEREKAKSLFENVFEKDQIVNYELSITDGVITDVLVNASIYKNERNETLGAVLVARDITHIKKIEHELTNAKLFAEEATRQAQKATLIAEIATESKQQFLSNMSHEIRTPMNAIIGFTKVMLKTALTFKQKEFLNAIKISGDAMIVLINDILDLAKVNAGKMTYEETPFKMQKSIATMQHLFEARLRENNIDFIINYDENIPEVLLGDNIRLHQIILNLLSNAEKFTHSGTISFSVKCIEEDATIATILFTITDTGIGISPEKLIGIFENFQQAYSDTSKLYGGTGLGLAIAKQLVETQGGGIKVTSKLKQGSTFSFTLPFKKTDIYEIIENDAVIIDTDFKQVKVLVVEDMRLNQLLMRTVLEDFGYECTITDNGKLAIELVKNNEYDIILMDLQMPEMNGFEATAYIRKELRSNIPIIALTADVTTVDVEKCKAAGMNDYLAKPIDEKLLYNKIITTLKNNVEKKLLKETIIITEKINKNYINLSYLNQRTKANPTLLSEIIEVYLEQTPLLITTMKLSFETKDWQMLQATIHKMLPSFSIMGFDERHEQTAKKIHSYALTQLEMPNIHELINEIEEACLQACVELQAALQNFKK